MTPVSTAIVYILNFGNNIYIHKVSPWTRLFMFLKFSRFAFGPATAMKGLWGRHLVVFVGLFSVLVADKEFWWMGQEGTFGQGSNQVRNCENPIFSFRHFA